MLVQRGDCEPNTQCVGAIKSTLDNPTLSFDETLGNVVTNIGTFPEERTQNAGTLSTYPTVIESTNYWFDLTSTIDADGTVAAGDNSAGHMMQSEGGGYAPPTANECATMKSWAKKKSSSFFVERRF